MPKAAPYTASNGFAVSIDQNALLASPDVRGLVASVLAVVEREPDAAVNDHLMIRQAAFVMLLTLRETLPMSMPLTWPRPRLPMTIRLILPISTRQLQPGCF